MGAGLPAIGPALTDYSAAGLRFFSGARPSELVSGALAFGLAVGLRFTAFLSPVFFSVFFFLVPAALPDALTFFGPL
ncbi:hypothetical protein D3C81_1992580 [compost metagenome]